jgi:hypothetical protein
MVINNLNTACRYRNNRMAVYTLYTAVYELFHADYPAFMKPCIPITIC